jgi:Spy/CpxP family protein refolding chaperone
MAVIAAGALAIASIASGQQQGQNNPGGQQGGFQAGQQGGGFQGGGGQGRGFDPSQIRTQLSNQVKEQLGATDEEWAVLGPKIEHISQIQADTGGGMMGSISLMMRNFSRMARQGGGGGGGFQGGGGRGPGGIDMSAILGPETPLRRKLTALSTALDNPATPAADIKQLLASIREDRERAKVELTKSRQELIELLTPRQEGILFQMGILE